MINKKYKVAIIHDSFTHMGGAEKILLHLIDVFPEADIFTSIIKREYLNKLKIKSKGKIFYSKLSKLKWITDNPDYFKLYILTYWQRLNLDKYHLVISSSHSFCSNWVNVKGIHVSYIHTPPRYLYDEFNEMLFLKKFPLKQIFAYLFNWIRKIDYDKVQKIDILIANSKNVQKRIKKYYNKTSIVIYPPIDNKINKYTSSKNKIYYVFFSRLVKQKGCMLAIKTFNINGKKLVVIGQGKEYRKLKKVAKGNIKFLGFQPDSKLSNIFSKAKALIYCSIEEDFGLIPLESMSYGIPVIAFKSGGVKETIIENKTGLFFEKYTTRNLNTTIDKFENMNFNENVCRNWANSFSKNEFNRKFIKTINSIMK